MELKGGNLAPCEMRFTLHPEDGNQFGQSVAFGIVFQNAEGEELKVNITC